MFKMKLGTLIMKVLMIILGIYKILMLIKFKMENKLVSIEA